MVTKANDIWPDGPSGMPSQPRKSEIRAWGTWLESIIGAFFSTGGKIYQTRALLNADLTQAANSIAWVMEDPTTANNGIYRKVGGTGTGSWVRAGDLPFSFIVASNPGAGTANAIQATTSVPVSSSALVLLPIAATNTSSPVTVAYNGGAVLTIKTNSGNDIAIGGLPEGMIALGIKSGSTFRLVSDQASAALVAAAEAAEAAAREARDEAVLLVGKADTAIQPGDNADQLVFSTTVPALPDFVRTAAGKLSDTISLLDFGGNGDGVADNSPAWAKAVAKLASLPTGGRLYLPRGIYRFVTAIALPKVLGKAFEVYGDGDSTVLDISATPTGAKSIAIGSSDPSPPANTVFRNLLIRGGGSTTNYAIEALNAHSMLFDHVTFEDMRAAVGASNSFAMRFSYCVWKRIGNNAFYSDTACHDLVFDNPKAYGVGNDANGRFVQIEVATDNVVIREPNFEYCRQAVSMPAGGSLLVVEGGYIEYCTVPMFAFNAPMYGARISDIWLAESPDLAIENMIGGEFKRVDLYNHKVSFSSSSRDVASADIKRDGTATFTPCASTTVSSFLNGATSSGTYPVRYAKRDGWVELGGLLNVTSMDNAAFQLPADYRPAIDKKFTIQSQSGNIGYVIVGSNGNVVPNVPGQTTAWVDGVKFFCGR